MGQSSDSLRLTGDLGVVGFDRHRVVGIARRFEEGTDIGVHCSGVPATGSRFRSTDRLLTTGLQLTL